MGHLWDTKRCQPTAVSQHSSPAPASISAGHRRQPPPAATTTLSTAREPADLGGRGWLAGSAVAALRALVEQLTADAGEGAVGGAVDHGRVERGDTMAVLEGQHDPEVPLERAADGVARQGAQELAAVLLTGWGDIVLAEGFAGPIGGCRRDDFPGVGQRVADDGEERGVVYWAALGGVQDRCGDVEGHKSSWQ